MNQDHSKINRRQKVLKVSLLIYLAVIHIWIVFYAVPAMTVFRNEITKEQASRLAYVAARLKCQEEQPISVECKQLVLKSIVKEQAGFNENAKNEWIVTFWMPPRADYQYTVLVSAEGEILNHLGQPDEAYKPN